MVGLSIKKLWFSYGKSYGKSCGVSTTVLFRPKHPKPCPRVLSVNRLWLVVFRHPSEKYEFVSWDDDSSQLNQYMESHKSHVPNHRPGLYLFLGVQLNGVFLFLLAVLKRKRWRSGEKDLVTTRHRNWEFKRLLWKIAHRFRFFTIIAMKHTDFTDMIYSPSMYDSPSMKHIDFT